MAVIKAIEEAVPQLIDLAVPQRQAMTRYSDKDLGFILKALSVAEQHPEIMSPNFDLGAMRRDVDALQKLDGALRAMTRIMGRFEDSRYAAGSEGKAHANTIYQFAKSHTP